MLKTVEGKYEDGKVTLAETPKGIRRARVIVTFLEAAPESEPPAEFTPPSEPLRAGVWRDRGLPDMTLEEFQSFRASASSGKRNAENSGG